MKLYIVVTSFNESATIGKAVEQIICPNKDLWSSLQLIVTAPDEPTLKEADKVCQMYRFGNCQFIKDRGEGKASAMNLAVETIKNKYPISPDNDVIIFTDGDMYIADSAVKNLLKSSSFAGRERIGGVGGHPVSLDDCSNMFGYYSHLFCEAAHIRRLNYSERDCLPAQAGFSRQGGLAMTKKDVAVAVPMSGYLYAVRADLLNKIFPIPLEVRAEDAYISQKILSLGCKTAYAPDALAYVKFPKNLSDWYRQKTRSLGGNVQLDKSSRSIIQDFRMILFPLLFAKSPKEFLWSLLLYPLRFLLWIKIYYNHALKRYRSGAWDRIESSK